MELIEKGISRITIQQNWHIGVIESNIKDYLTYCEIWGDLNISPKEYEIVKNKISATFGNRPGIMEVEELLRRYPLVMVTDFINFVLYEFDNSDFWSRWSNRYNLELSPAHRTEIGKKILAIFRKQNYEIIRDEGFVYVTPIIYQAGIPSVCFDKLFDIVDSTLNSNYFIPHEIVSELMGIRSYLIDVPALRFIRAHEERAIELLAQLREMMLVVGDVQQEDQVLPEMPGVQPRIVQRYMQWKAELKKQGRGKGKTTQYFFSPKLVYDEVRGICLLIPEQTLRQDSIYKLRWTIIRDNDSLNPKTCYSQVYNSGNRNFTQEVKIPVEPARNYTVELRDEARDSNLLTNPWNVVGLGEEGHILVFNENGVALPRNQRFLSKKGTIFVIDRKMTKIKELRSLNKVELAMPKSWTGLEALAVYPTEDNALIAIQTSDRTVYIESNPSFEIELVQKGTLFNEKYNRNEIPVFTQFPLIEVSGDKRRFLEQKAFLNWQVVFIHRLSHTQRLATLSNLEFHVYEDCMRINPEVFAREHFEGLFGAYEIKVYDGKNKRSFTFYLSPKFEYVSQIEAIPSIGKAFANNRVVFQVKKQEGFTLEFGNESGVNVFASPKGGEWSEFSTNEKPAYIKGHVAFSYNGLVRKFPFKKTIREFEWSYWDERETEMSEIGITKQFYREDFDKTTWHLALQFTGAVDKYKMIRLVLEGVTREELQSKELKLDSFGRGAATLNMFQDTMGVHQLPQRIMLHIIKEFDKEYLVCLGIIRSFVQLKNPKYKRISDKPMILWDPGVKDQLLNKQLEITSLSDLDSDPITFSLADGVRTMRSKDGQRFEGFELQTPLSPGLYYIDAKEDMEFSFFEEEEPRPIFDGCHVISVQGEEVLEKFFANQSANVKEWLSVALLAMKKLKWLADVSVRLRHYIEESRKEMVFEVKECADYLFAVILNAGERSNLASEVKTELLSVSRLINDFIITNQQRVELLQAMLHSKISDTDCKIILNELQLYLFSPNGKVSFDKPTVQRMWDINDKLAILINLRNCVSNLSVDFNRVVDRIGREALEQMINFKPKESCPGRDWDECMERCLGGRCNCRYVQFECSKKVWGDGDEYSKLWIADKKGNWKRQDPDSSHTDGYEFFGKNYLKLVYELTPEIQQDSIKNQLKKASQEIYKVELLTAKYSPYLHAFQPILRNRLAGSAGNQKLFYLVGCISVLQALATRRFIDATDLQELLPFYKNTIGAYPELVYRDLILAEMTVLFKGGGGFNCVHASD